MEEQQSKARDRWQKVRHLNLVNGLIKQVFYKNSFRDNKTEEEDTIPVSRCRKILRTTYYVATSHFGLMSLLILYSIIGAGIFHLIESTQRGLTDSEKFSKARNETVTAIIQDLSGVLTFNNSQIDSKILTQLVAFESKLKDHHLLKVSETADKEWDYWGSMLYCMTVYTTIGYGVTAPRTTAGKWITIVYALFGIPLFLVTIADLGMAIKKLSKYTYLKFRNFFNQHCCKKCINKTKQVIQPLSNELTEPSIKSQHQDQKVQVNDKKCSEENGDSKMWTVADEMIQKKKTKKPKKKVIDDDELKINIAIPVILTIIYIVLGVVMFMQWEHWSFTDAFYFMFISLSTIGLGDVYPVHRNYFLISSVYLILGLTLLAMILAFLTEVTNTALTKAKKKVESVAKQKLGLAQRQSTKSHRRMSLPIIELEKKNKLTIGNRRKTLHTMVE